MADQLMTVVQAVKAGVLDVAGNGSAEAGNAAGSDYFYFPNDGHTLLVVESGTGDTVTFTAVNDPYGRTETLAPVVSEKNMAKTAGSVLVGVATLYYHATAGTAVGSVTTEVGYTEDGVTIEYAPTINDIEVEEETVPISRVITKEDISITCNMAESDLEQLELALAGSSRAGDVITLGGGEIQNFAIKIVGTAPSAATRTIYAGYVHPTGTVGMSYKKGEKTIVPVTLKPYLNTSGGTVITITDA